MTAAITGRVRQILQKAFYNFGLHCTTHRIRVLLISCVVITSLFYPTLAIYSSSQPQFLARYSSLLGSLAGSGPHHDLHDLWTDHTALRVREDSVTRARCGNDRTLRAERLLIQSTESNGHGSLSREMIMSLAKFQERISAKLVSPGFPCLEAPGGQCVVISPLDFMRDTKMEDLTDSRVRQMVSIGRNISVYGAQVTPEMVLGDREAARDETLFDWTSYMSVTYFFPETDCIDGSGHHHWLDIINQASDNETHLDIPRFSPRLLALQYDPYSAGEGGTSILTWFIYLAYAVFFFWFSGSMRQLHTVHSRVGLAFTGLVEIIVSTITSLSVCALAGFKITMVPWELFPVIIVFVGAENMFALVNSVVGTSIALPVKTRIAEGLSRAGASNTLKAISYNAILGVIAVFSQGAIRQFCALALVVLVAHWSLVHTFFVAVLSIDLQRLELDDLLRQNSSLTSSPKVHQSARPAPTRTSKSKIAHAVRVLWDGRASRNLSLLMLLAITVTLHYATSPAQSALKSDARSFMKDYAKGAARTNNQTAPPTITPALNVWQLLNPSSHDLVHIRQEPPVIVTFHASVDSATLSDGSTRGNTHSRSSTRMVRQATRIVKLFVIPIALTTTVLYGILLFLLKDTDLVEAQRNRAEAEAAQPIHPTTLPDFIRIASLERLFTSDTELIASNANGSVIAAVGLHNELVVWNRDAGTTFTINYDRWMVKQGSSAIATTTLTALVIDHEGKLCAFGTGTGLVMVWKLGARGASPIQKFPSPVDSSAVVSIYFAKKDTSTPYPLPVRGNDKDPFNTALLPNLVVAYQDGSVHRWAMAQSPRSNPILPHALGDVVRCSFAHTAGADLIVAGFVMEDGALHVKTISSDTFMAEATFPAGRPSELVTQFSAAVCRVGSAQRLVIATVSTKGGLSLWDTVSGDCIATLHDDLGPGASNLLVTPLASSPCLQCEEPVADVLSVSVVVRSTLLFFRLFLPGHAARCRCPRSRAMDDLVWRSLVTARPRAFSSSSGRNTPRMRSRANSFNSEIPISGHGIHSKRASEKESRRTASETLLFSGMHDGFMDHSPPTTETLGPLPNLHLSTLATPPLPSPWQDAILEPVYHSEFDRGSCAVVGTRFVGLRRRPRPCTEKSLGSSLVGDSAAFSASTLERWELWMFDPLVGIVQSSPLGQVVSEESPRIDSSWGSTTRTGIQRLPFTRVSAFNGWGSFCLAGLGNTVVMFSVLS